MSSSALAAGLRHLRSQMAAQQRRDDSDEQLLHAFLSRRDDGAFAVLVRRHGPMVLHVCRRVLGHEQDAEDAFQATFLVLARNAAALRKKTALASFLHGIAYRTAMKAKRSAARRRKHESRAPAHPPADPADVLSWQEVRALLDEEIARLPEIYRSVFVLFHLEDLSREETARRLGLKDATVAKRLAKARERLSQRLSRRGVELTAVLAATAVATPSASAVPVGLMATTIEAALTTAAGEGWSGIVSASVVELVQKATAAMMVSKAKIATVVLLIVGTSGSLVGLAWRASEPLAATAEATAAKADDKRKNASNQSKATKVMEIRGRVLGPDGKPKEGAKLLLLGEEGDIKQLGASKSDGRFAVAIPKGFFRHWLIAQTRDAGIDFLHVDQWKTGKPVELRLVKDNVIRGRVVNTEGRPIHGVRVAVKSIDVYPDNSLDFFLTAWKKRHFQRGMPGGEKDFWSETAALLPVRPDADGRFALYGIGAERTALLHLSGAGIADAELWIVNRAGFDPKPYNQATLDNIPKGMERYAYRLLLHGPDAAAVVEPEKPIRGVVKDADSGKGCPNVQIWLTRKNEGELLDVPLQTTTDARGRYEMHGARKAKRYMLDVKDDPATGYVRSRVWIEDKPGYEPIAADIRLKKGVIVTGKILDGSTGKPIDGFAEAAVLKDNPFVKDYPEFENFPRPEYTTAEGIFRVVTIPGPVLLMGGLNTRWGGWVEGLKYEPPHADAKHPQYFRRMSNHWLYYGHSGGHPVQGCFCKVLRIEPGAMVVKQDIILKRTSVLAVQIEDAEGQPLPGVWAAGIGPEDVYPAVRMKEASCSVYGLETRKPRLLVFYEPNQKLAGSLTLKGEEKPPLAVKLGSAGAIKGRLLDADGKPLASVVVRLNYRDREADAIRRSTYEVKPAVTDAAGVFTIDGIIPERKFTLYSLHRGKPLLEAGSKPRQPILHEVKPGECRDLGAIKLKPLSENAGE